MASPPREGCAPKLAMSPALAHLIRHTVRNESVMSVGTIDVPGARHITLRHLCASESHEASLLPASDWFVSIGAAELLPPPCVSTFFQAMHASRKGVILAWGLSRALNDTCCEAPSMRHPLVIHEALALLNFRLRSREHLMLPTAHNATREVAVRVSVWLHSRPFREQYQDTIDGCAGTVDGAFHTVNQTWPLRDHFLDGRLAQCIARMSANGSVLDVGGGSGQYGAFFHLQHADASASPIVVRGVTFQPQGPGGVGPTSWMTVDGTAGIEEHTRRYGPPGSLVLQANLCNQSLRLPVHDWVISFEVGEHLPTWCLANYLALLHRSNRRGLIISWSSFSAGTCHINAKAPQAVGSYLTALGGYKFDSSRPCIHTDFSWLRKNQVFHRVHQGSASCKYPSALN
mmetsp:Transcript_46367/g.115004  ORF Transcript_46367/g.115004 Transcript_46367/m.115004 type:complete len:402 (+) Transcript_46367:43-1248(+)